MPAWQHGTGKPAIRQTTSNERENYGQWFGQAANSYRGPEPLRSVPWQCSCLVRSLTLLSCIDSRLRVTGVVTTRAEHPILPSHFQPFSEERWLQSRPAFTQDLDDQQLPHSFSYGMCAIAGPQLCLRFLEMATHSFHAQTKRAGNFFSRSAVRSYFQHGQLSLRQARAGNCWLRNLSNRFFPAGGCSRGIDCLQGKTPSPNPRACIAPIGLLLPSPLGGRPRFAFEQDAALERLMPALNLALGLRKTGSAGRSGDFLRSSQG